MQLHGRMSLKVAASFFQTTHFDIEHEDSELFDLGVLNKLIMKVLFTHAHRIVVHTGARQLNPNYTRNTPHPLTFSTLGVALLRPTGRPTTCEEGTGGTSDLSTGGWLTVGAVVVDGYYTGLQRLYLCTILLSVGL